MVADCLRSIPKVILHTHLEGSIPSHTLHELSTRNHIALSFDPFAKDIYKSIEAHNWITFRKIYSEICSCFQTEEDFYEALYSYGASLADESVIYAEIQFSPWKHLQRGISLNTLAKGFIKAIEHLNKKYRLTIKLTCDLVRNKDEQCDRILDWLIDLPRNHFVALGVSGGVNAIKRVHYGRFCEKAKKNGLKITAHAGEIEDHNSVMEIIDHFNIDRIGHGIRSKENPALLEQIILKDLHFEICPTANKIIGLCQHSFSPISDIISEGINFSINPDDELIFDTTVSKELELLIKEKIIHYDDVKSLQKKAIINSFASDTEKMKLINLYFND